MINVIDAFREFVICFQSKLELSTDEKIEVWDKLYSEKYNELAQKLKKDYKDSGFHWRNIAREKVFNRTSFDFPKMIVAYNNLLEVIDGIDEKVKKIFDIELDINIIIYSGLGNSAGWVDNYQGKRTILFGIDKIVELNWHTKGKVEALVAHELCHVIHFQLRGEDDIPKGVEINKYSSSIWRIYEEGFAQYYQNKLLINYVDARGQEWINRCNANIYELKNLYKKSLEDNEKGTRDFYGDWYKILEISDAGYYLGSQLIKELEKKLSITEIACLPFEYIEKEILNFLK